ncbi:hypothetical protein [Pseudomonas brassicacearum]|jgi:hypothetical protein|nr:hypothetical protein [Pseudomonas brassicacearum]
MSERILAMPGDFDSDLKPYQQVNSLGIESATLTIIKCGTIECTAVFC